jgi:hypothetical protein
MWFDTDVYSKNIWAQESCNGENSLTNEPRPEALPPVRAVWVTESKLWVQIVQDLLIFGEEMKKTKKLRWLVFFCNSGAGGEEPLFPADFGPPDSNQLKVQIKIPK